MRRPHVELSIDELVLEGFAPSDRHRIGDAVERHLALLLAEGAGAADALTHDADIESFDAGSFDAAPDSAPDAIGARVAQAIYGGLRR